MKKYFFLLIFYFCCNIFANDIYCPNSINCLNGSCTANSTVFTSVNLQVKPIPDGVYYFSYAYANLSYSTGVKGGCAYNNNKGESLIRLNTGNLIGPDLNDKSSVWTPSEYQRYKCAPTYISPYFSNPSDCGFEQKAK